MEKWFVAAKKADFDKWAKDFGISPVLARILRNRDLTEEADIEKFLHGTLEDCYSPWLLKDMDRAVEVIEQAVSEKKLLRVIGDYDVDGICSAYILTRGLEIVGAEVDTVIPHRMHDGYGLNDNLINEAKREGIELIVTCDNGIAAAPQIVLAASMGISVVVTDHHEVPFTEEGGERRELLPPALAVVDPKRGDCPYPYKNICGAVVAYKLLQALSQRMEREELEKALEEFLEFAALATVCDVMELKDENRILVKEGLQRLRRTQNQGIKALMEVNKIQPEKLSAYHLGFVIGPCLNATGRLDTAKRALELLRCGTKAEAMSAARELKDLNDSRKNLTLQGVEAAEQYMKEHRMEQDKVMLIFLPDVHESLAGIIAGRIREKYHHPVFVLTKGEDGVKGSGRSVEAYHMFEHMVRAGRYFTKYGGHKLAAGLSMKEEDIEPLRKFLNEDSGLCEEDFVPRVHIDVPMPLSYADAKLAEELSLLEPFGVENPKPLFAQKNLHFLKGYKMGANKNCARFRVRAPEGKEAEVVFFGDLERLGDFLNEKYGSGSDNLLYEKGGDFELSITYQLSLNTYQGRTNLQFIMRNYC
ncbi:MAG: single-stranded-DNA-specific exonuclease RecJ [Bacteroidales bacterium]|nr:single-stranded-DNA-specific exonuclease RecJ [Lachnoclostridium sp.]MCM1384268.1 single-stranded-DNA-specific exonuclease RecJ [Lachnoclostridium sp.]MCM1464767.1 single-stranded-DNA-specific exonuclease RecJ [Bacteroidales bacterium]